MNEAGAAVMRWRRTKFFKAACGFALLLCPLTSSVSRSEPPHPPTSPGAAYPSDIRRLIDENCSSCHGPKKQKGEIDFSAVDSRSAVLRSRPLWKAAAAQLASGEMPPEEAKHQPSPAERTALLDWMKRASSIDPNDPANHDPGPPLLRRLTVSEYNRTLRDLLGIDFDASQTAGIPADTATTGFTNLAVGLDLSPSLVEKYFTAADRVLERVFAANDPALASMQFDGNAKKKAALAYTTLVAIRPGAGVTPQAAARANIERFIRRAYRRPVEAAEVDRLVALFDSIVARGDAFETAMRLTLKPVLVSPHFLLRVEADRPAQEPNGAARVSDHELAVRLSYFLWSTLPDDELAKLADAGKLAEPAVFDAQVRRMLADTRAKALTENFGEQWLQLGKLAGARPSTEFFPAFTYNVRKLMHDEAATFFDKLREDDRPVLDLLDSDYTYLNGELAKYYGIPGVQGQKFVRVPLKPEYHRGGLLGMGAVLSLTSHTYRTSPTLRGKYVLDVILGAPPPPPPANVAQIQDSKDKKAPKSFREQLAQHAGDANCAGCHRKMDPLGFALDNFDAVGIWRTETGGKPLDVGGVLPTGEKFNGCAELKKVIHDRQDEFIRHAIRQMLSYALGRQLDYYDDMIIENIRGDLMKNDYRFSSLVAGVARSYPFLSRRPMLDGAADASH